MPDLNRFLLAAMQDDTTALWELLRYMERNQLQGSQFYSNCLKTYSVLDTDWDRDRPPGATWMFVGDPSFGGNYRHLALEKIHGKHLSICGTKVVKDPGSREGRKCVMCLERRYWVPVFIEKPSPPDSPFWGTPNGMEAHCFETHNLRGGDWYVKETCSKREDGAETFMYINRILSGFCYLHPHLFHCPDCVKLVGEPENSWYRKVTDL